MSTESQPHIAIACGGTGGHLFPGMAVARELLARRCRVSLFVSKKAVDRRAVDGVSDMKVWALPSVGLVRGRRLAFVFNLFKSVRQVKRIFRMDRPEAVLGMGGFASAAPLVAGRQLGAACYVHESNTVPGRANRWLSRYANEVLVGFPSAADRFPRRPIRVTGTPVRSEFTPVEPAIARRELGLRPADPVLLVMGGSQGAAGINRLVIEGLSGLVQAFPLLQFVHLTGTQDLAMVQAVYHQLGVKAHVQLFSAQIHLALGAATLAVSRAGASSLAEIAAVRTPSVLVPYPTAADNHQFYNAREFSDSGAAVLVEQNSVSGKEFEQLMIGLLQDTGKLAAMKRALAHRDAPSAAVEIADAICASERVRGKLSSVGARGARSDAATLRSVESVIV